MRSVWGSSVVTLLVAASPGAFAADMRPAMVPPPVYNWTGFYVGGNLGGAWAHTTLTDDFTGQSFVGGSKSCDNKGSILAVPRGMLF